MSIDRPIEHVLDALEGVEQQHNGYFKAVCPAHDDHNPSLDIKEAEENGTVLVHCHVCKDQEKVLRALEERGIASRKGAAIHQRPAPTSGQIQVLEDA